MKPSWAFFTSRLPISQLFIFWLHSWPLCSYVYLHPPGGQWRSSGSGTTRTKGRIFHFLLEMLRGTLWRSEGVLKRFMKFLVGTHRPESRLGLLKRPRWVFLLGLVLKKYLHLLFCISRLRPGSDLPRPSFKGKFPRCSRKG